MILIDSYLKVDLSGQIYDILKKRGLFFSI